MISGSVSAGLGFDQGNVKPLVEEVWPLRDAVRVPLLERAECREFEPLGALDDGMAEEPESSVQGINVVFALLKKFFVPWLNLSSGDGPGAGRF